MPCRCAPHCMAQADSKSTLCALHRRSATQLTARLRAPRATPRVLPVRPDHTPPRVPRTSYAPDCVAASRSRPSEQHMPKARITCGPRSSSGYTGSPEHHVPKARIKCGPRSSSGYTGSPEPPIPQARITRGPRSSSGHTPLLSITCPRHASHAALAPRAVTKISSGHHMPKARITCGPRSSSGYTDLFWASHAQGAHRMRPSLLERSQIHRGPPSQERTARPS